MHIVCFFKRKLSKYILVNTVNHPSVALVTRKHTTSMEVKESAEDQQASTSPVNGVYFLSWNLNCVWLSRQFVFLSADILHVHLKINVISTALEGLFDRPVLFVQYQVYFLPPVAGGVILGYFTALKKIFQNNNQKTQINTFLLCRCSLTNQEPGTTTTTPTWPRKQVLDATVTLKMCCRSSMLTLLHNVSCVYQYCDFILCQVKRRWQMQESGTLTLNKLV